MINKEIIKTLNQNTITNSITFSNTKLKYLIRYKLFINAKFYIDNK